MRQAEIIRKTNETDIRLRFSPDGTGQADVDTGIGFLDHMLTLFACHGRFDLFVRCKGDVKVDEHHSAEDIGIALGMALRQALGDKRGIARYGTCILPMDEALVLSAADLSGRAFLNFDVRFPTEKIGAFDTELVKEFWLAFVREGAVTLHVKLLTGENSHHIAEGIFKSAARCLRQAVAPDEALGNEIPSSKGAL